MSRLKPVDECAYYLVREMDGLGAKAKDIYYDSILEHIRKKGLGGCGLISLEIKALVAAARQRDRLEELDAAIERSLIDENNQAQC